MKNKKYFTNVLMQWHRNENNRSMPWKGEKGPYKVWLSEIILQQTRVEQGWSYYEKFIHAFPNVTKLANAKDEVVFKMWEGLGYYNRCKNLLHSARVIDQKYAGRFPADYHSILNLKGIGAYTASAIASFCFGLPYAVVDGNVLRVLSRYFGIETPVDTTEGKRIFTSLAQECLDTTNPAGYNQSIMDFGATICKPAPECHACLLQKTCMAFKKKKIDLLPVKQKTILRKERWFTYFIFICNNKIFVQQRNTNDIWPQLFEFYLAETEKDPVWDTKKISEWLRKKFNIKNTGDIIISKAKKQILTHQIIRGYFIYTALEKKPALKIRAGKWLTQAEMRQLAIPKFINQFNYKKVLQLYGL